MRNKQKQHKGIEQKLVRDYFRNISKDDIRERLVTSIEEHSRSLIKDCILMADAVFRRSIQQGYDLRESIRHAKSTYRNYFEYHNKRRHYGS